MIKYKIKNSPGYYITKTGMVYNSSGTMLKTFLKTDGYVRIRLPQIRHNMKRVNISVHIIMAETFLGLKYGKTKLQVNHIDGNKQNNKLENLELVTGTENVNKAHNSGLYTHDLKMKIFDIKTNKFYIYRSLREVSRTFNVSINYLKVRVPISKVYPLFNRYKISIDETYYINHILKLKGKKTLYVKNHMNKEIYKLTAFTQLSLLFGISDTVVRHMLINKHYNCWYIAGCSISFDKKQVEHDYVDIQTAIKDRNSYWLKLKNYGVESSDSKRCGVV